MEYTLGSELSAERIEGSNPSRSMLRQGGEMVNTHA